jgi:hypothetical protein
MIELNKPGMRFALIEHKLIDAVRMLQNAGIEIHEVVVEQATGEVYRWERRRDSESERSDTAKEPTSN